MDTDRPRADGRRPACRRPDERRGRARSRRCSGAPGECGNSRLPRRVSGAARAASDRRGRSSLRLAPGTADPRFRVQPRVLARARARRGRGGLRPRDGRPRPPRRAAGPLPVTVAARPLLQEGVEIDPDGVAQSCGAVLGGARAFASLALLGTVPAGPAWPGELELSGPGRVMRALAHDGAELLAAIREPDSSYRRL